MRRDDVEKTWTYKNYICQIVRMTVTPKSVSPLKLGYRCGHVVLKGDEEKSRGFCVHGERSLEFCVSECESIVDQMIENIF